MLAESGVDEVPVVVALLDRLPGTPPLGHPFRLLTDEAERWAEEVPRRWEHGGRPFECALLDAAVDVFRTVDRGASRLVNQDLHGWNVLRAEREPWLVVDPKPLVGVREIDGVGPLRNAGFTGETARVRRWLDALSELGLDRELLRGFGLAHALVWGTEVDGSWSERSIAAARTISRA
jgi:streptomycin 6-kinase